MRSSDQRSRRRRPEAASVVAAMLILLCAVLASGLRSRLLLQFQKVKLQRDAYALPSPEQTLVASLGYRSALADLIYGSVLVSYGLHFQERRPFEFAGAYLDTMTTLDPKFGAAYYISDTLLTLQPTPPPVENFKKAREILERGLRERPEDSRIWIQAGQFMAYLGPAKFKDRAVKREWRLAGARVLARACELLAEDEFQPHHCITAAGILSRDGQVEATVQFLQRVLAVSDNEEIREIAFRMLEMEKGEAERLRVEQRYQVFQELWSRDLTFASKHLLLVLGPPFDPAQCAGALGEQAQCATTWREWSRGLSQ